MHKGVDDVGEKRPMTAPRAVCSCGSPFGHMSRPDGTVAAARLCPRCDFSPPLIAA